MGLKVVLTLHLLLLSFFSFSQIEKYSYYQHQSKIYFDQDRFKDAEKFADSVLILAIRTGHPDSLSHAYLWMSRVHLAKKDYQKALQDLQTGSIYKDSVTVERSIARERQWLDESMAEKEKNAKEIQRLQSEMAEIRELNSQDRRNFLVIFTGIIALALITAIFLYRKNTRLEQQVLQSGSENSASQEFKTRLFGVLAGELEKSLTLLESNLKRGDVPQSIKQSAADLKATLNHIVGWVSYQADVRAFYRSEFDCKELAESTLEKFKSEIAGKMIHVDFLIPEGQQAYADRDMIAIAMENLLSNAVRFTPAHGRITIFSGKKDDLITLGIKDSGTGISAEEIKGLFEMRGQPVLGPTPGTSGIGLVISKELIEKNGGNIYVESETGKGSTFYFSIPGKKID